MNMGLSCYNRMLQRFQLYCVENCFEFPPKCTAHVVGFLCRISDSSERPSSQLKIFSAMCSALYEFTNTPNPVQTVDVQKFITALVKSGTSKPMGKTKLLPIKNFTQLFMSWEDNSHLSIKSLRLKCLTLLALCLMLRPSDVAPKGVQFNASDMTVDKLIFSKDMVSFQEDSMLIRFHGIKNDTSRKGFEVSVPRASVKKLDPVDCLQYYIEKTDCHRSVENNAVFLGLNKPHKALSSSAVAGILQEAIDMAGLKNQGFSAKSFRPTGATAAVSTDCDPNVAMQLGRWKSETVFFEHYVH